MLAASKYLLKYCFSLLCQTIPIPPMLVFGLLCGRLNVQHFSKHLNYLLINILGHSSKPFCIKWSYFFDASNASLKGMTEWKGNSVIFV